MLCTIHKQMQFSFVSDVLYSINRIVQYVQYAGGCSLTLYITFVAGEYDVAVICNRDLRNSE